MFKILAILALTALASATLEVYSPECAKQKFLKGIDYTLSNFGQIPYGQTIIGEIFIPTDDQLCATEGQQSIDTEDSTLKKIFLVKRGTCKFTKKVINAQDLGADLIIIYDNNPGSVPSIIMRNDGHGINAEIPSLFISNTDGLNLLKAKKECGKYPMMRVHFEMDQTDISEVTFWLDAGNRQTYILAREFHKKHYYDVLREKLNLKIGFRLENTCDDWICGKNDCVAVVGGDKFCRNVKKPDDPNVPYTKGMDLINQQIRQYYLWKQISSKDNIQNQLWWKYMAKFDDRVCIQEKDVADCSYTVMSDISIPTAIIDRVKTESQSTLRKVTDKKPNILQQVYKESREMGIFFYPEVTINDRNFYGLFKAPQVFQAICDSLIDPPDECINFIEQNHEEYHIDGTTGLWKTVLIILLVMTAIFLIALFIYTKIIRNEMNQQLSVEVNKMVQKYVNLTGKKSNTNNSSYSKFDG